MNEWWYKNNSRAIWLYKQQPIHSSCIPDSNELPPSLNPTIDRFPLFVWWFIEGGTQERPDEEEEDPVPEEVDDEFPLLVVLRPDEEVGST